jgi:hypothetical protein
MGNAFAGIVHPSKIYNILSIGSPFLYIGPEESHIGDIIKNVGHNGRAYFARHGEVAKIMDIILDAQKESAGRCLAFREFSDQYSGTNLLPRMVEALECAPPAFAEPEIVWEDVRSGILQ